MPVKYVYAQIFIEQDAAHEHFFRCMTDPIPGVHANCIVVGSACEVRQDGTPLVGAARITIHGIAPNANSRIFFLVNVMWNNPMWIRVYFVISNEYAPTVVHAHLVPA